MYMVGETDSTAGYVTFHGPNECPSSLRTPEKGNFKNGSLTIDMLHAMDGVLMLSEVLSLPISRYKGDKLSQVIMFVIISAPLFTFSSPKITLKAKAIISSHLSP